MAAPAGAQQAVRRAGTGGARHADGSAWTLPADYLIGPQDVLSIVFWREKDMSADVVVRPDGKISLPLLERHRGGGPDAGALRAAIAKAAAKFIEEPNVTVVVKEINSRNVYITGQVTKPGSYPLTSDMTVLQLIARPVACSIRRLDEHRHHAQGERARSRFKFNYKDVMKGKNVDRTSR